MQFITSSTPDSIFSIKWMSCPIRLSFCRRHPVVVHPAYIRFLFGPRLCQDCGGFLLLLILRPPNRHCACAPFARGFAFFFFVFFFLTFLPLPRASPFLSLPTRA